MMKRPNDIGGQRAGPIDANAREPAMWQKRLSALVSSLGPANRGVIRIDEFRRTREDLPKEVYDRLTYFELWTEGIAGLLIEKGVLTRAEIDGRMAEKRNN